MYNIILLLQLLFSDDYSADHDPQTALTGNGNCWINTVTRQDGIFSTTYHILRYNLTYQRMHIGYYIKVVQQQRIEKPS